jgi:GDSL-like Lipase/Acylhydrolase family
MKKFIKIFLINFTIFLCLIIIIELIFGGWFSDRNKLNNLGVLRNFKLQYPLHGLYPDSTGYVNYSRDKYGLRGISSFNDPGKIDILTVGGSTTEQRYIDDSKTWQEVLEAALKRNNKNFILSNAGIEGQSTYGHIKDFEIWFPRIPGLKPKYVLFYIGINDFYRCSDDPRYEVFDGRKNSLRNIIKNNSCLVNLYRKLRGALKAKKMGIGHEKKIFSNYTYTDTGIGDPNLADHFRGDHIKNFKKRLLRLVELTHNLGAEPVFLTQPSIIYRFIDGKLSGSSFRESFNNLSYNGVDYYNSLSELNKVIYEVAGNNITVVELTNLPIWEFADFYDWIHMTPTGEMKLGNEIYKQLKDKLK